MGEDSLLERPELGSGFEAEFILERLAAAAVDIERVGVAPAAVESEHQLPEQPLTVGVAADEALEFADHVAVMAEQQVGVETVLERPQALFLQARHLALREWLICQIRERLSPPEPERGIQQLPGAEQASSAASTRRASATLASNRSAST